MLRTRPFLVLLAVPLFFVVVLLARVATRGADRSEHSRSAPAEAPFAPRSPSSAARSVRPVEAGLAVAVARTTSIVVPGSPGVFEGRVVSGGDGEAIPAAELTFTLGRVAARAHTAADGRFRFVPPAAGRWTVTVVTASGFLPFAPEWGHSPALLDTRPGAHVRNIVVTLTPAVPYRALVVDPRGQPVGGAEVRVFGAGAGETALVPLRDRYVTNGRGETSLIAPPDAVIEATARGFGSGRAAVDFAARVGGRIQLRLPPERLPSAEAEIAGAVQLPSGSPAADALVVAWPRWPDPEGAPQQALCDAQGAFRIGGLATGTYDVVARVPGLAEARALDVRPGGPPLALRLLEGERLSGRVVDAATGAAVSPFTLLVRGSASAAAEPIQSLAVLDPDGRFVLEALPPGSIHLVAVAPGHPPSPPLRVEVPSGADAVLRLARGGAVHGVVRRRGTGAPVEGAEVTVEAEPSPAPSATPVRAGVLTGADGRFELAGLPPRPVSLFVLARGHYARVVPVAAVTEGERYGPVDVDVLPVAPGESAQVETTGIGAVLALRGEVLVVQKISVGGGAAEAGLAVGDEIVQVDGRPVAALDFDAAIGLVRGSEGTTVVLDVRRQGDRAREERVLVLRRLIRG